MKTKEEIKKLYDLIFDRTPEVNKKYFGMGYGDAVQDTIEWILEEDIDHEKDLIGIVKEALKELKQ